MGTVTLSSPIGTVGGVVVNTRGSSSCSSSGCGSVVGIQTFTLGAIISLDVVSATVATVIIARGHVVHVVTPSISFPVWLFASGSSGGSCRVVIINREEFETLNM